jgi:signal transduction histidine kinase
LDRQQILVVDDHKPLRKAVQMVLEREGYDVLTAADGAQALSLMEDHRPDLIVADIMMPEMDGYDFYRAVRSRPEGISIPFIFLTAKSEREDVLKGKALGAEDYLTKPLHPQELLVAVRSRLERARAVRETIAAELDQLKNRILITLGHELRTPLTHVISYADLALEDIGALPPELLQEFLVTIRQGGERMSGLVEDLLLVIRLDAGRLAEEFRQFSQDHDDLEEIVLRTVWQYEESASDQGLQLDVRLAPDLPPVRLYEPFFVDALGRLVDNAIKFSRGKGEQIWVDARVSRARPGYWAEPGDELPRGKGTGQSELGLWGVEVAVTDEGVGIAPKEVPHLFERFRQIDRARMEQQGVGLGLHIARELVCLHNGDIVVDSVLGEGSTFTIQLPPATPPTKVED